MAKMGGPFIPFPQDIIDLFDGERGRTALGFYMRLLCRVYLEPVEDPETDWVGAYVHCSIGDVVKLLGGSGHIRKTIIPFWTAIGVFEIADNGAIYLPMYYRKGDAYIQPLKMSRDIASLKQAHGETKSKQIEMEKTIADLLELLSNQREVITIPETGHRSNSTGDRSISPVTGFSVSLLSSRSEKISLSVLQKIISVFYQGVGKKRVSGAEREAAVAVIRSLEKDGFSDYEIAFAVDWTIKPGNTREKPHSFKIIFSTIGAAVEALEKMDRKVQQEATVVEAKQSREDQYENEQAAKEAMVKQKEAMDTEERLQLHEQALTELRDLGVYKEDMITDVLITIQENAILAKGDNNLTDVEDDTRLNGAAEGETS